MRIRPTLRQKRLAAVAMALLVVVGAVLTARWAVDHARARRVHALVAQLTLRSDAATDAAERLSKLRRKVEIEALVSHLADTDPLVTKIVSDAVTAIGAPAAGPLEDMVDRQISDLDTFWRRLARTLRVDAWLFPGEDRRAMRARAVLGNLVPLLARVGPEGGEKLLELARSRYPWLRDNAISTLIHQQDPRAFEILVGLLGEKDRDVKRRVARGVNNYMVFAPVSDEDANGTPERQAAWREFQRTKAKALPLLLAGIEDTDVTTRQEYAWPLARYTDSPEAFEVFTRLASEPKIVPLRHAALTFMLQSTDVRASGIVVRMLADAAPGVRRHAAAYLPSQPPEHRLDAIRAALASSEAALHDAAVRNILATGDEFAIAAFTSLYAGASDQAKADIIRALENHKTSFALEARPSREMLERLRPAPLPGK